MEDTGFFLVIGLLAFFYFAFMTVINSIKGAFSGSSGGSFSNGSDFKQVIQRGRHIDVVRNDNSGLMFEGELRGWSSKSISFVSPSGDTGTYDTSGSFSYHY